MTQAWGYVENRQVRMHDLIAAGVAAARQRKRWTQEEAARWFRYYGLTTWRTSTVGSLESGLRRPRLDEVLLMCAALEISAADLVPDDLDELIELGDGAAMSAPAIRALLSGDWSKFPHDPADFRYPGGEREGAAFERAGAERDRQRALIKPILDWAGLDPWSEQVLRVFLPPSDAEAHAARRMKVEPVQVKAASLAKWDQDFESERDSRVGDTDELEPRSRQARRGLVTREMLRDLRVFLNEVYGLDQAGSQDDGQEAP
jgi:transcriptional regulator with XRE-family HTH domain